MKLRKFIVHIVLFLVAFICLFWIYTLFINATRSGANMRGITLIPGGFLLNNIGNLIYSPYPILSAFKNSAIISITSAAGCVYFASLCAYGFSMYDFKCKKALYIFLLIIMMIPTQVSILGYVDLARKMKLSDTLLSVIFPRMAVPITFYYIYQFMKVDISKAYIEAARIDGAGELEIFHKIIFPMLKPAVAVQFIFEFVSSWNSFFVPAVMISTDTKKPISIIVVMLRTLDAGVGYAMIAVSIFPVILIYLLLSKQIVQGITAGGIKA